MKPHTIVSLQEHVRDRQIELATSLEPRKAIYLDTKFWIILRDVELGVRTGELERELLRRLRHDVSSRRIFCPISDTAFAELLKITDLRSRMAIAALMDELSLGVTLIPFDLRAGTELAHFLYSALTPNTLHPLHHLVWSKLAYVMGFLHPQGMAFERIEELRIQVMFFEHMWTITMQEMIAQLSDAAPPGGDIFAQLATRLNNLNAQHVGQLRTFEQTYKDEIHGVIDVFMDAAIGVIDQMVRLQYGALHQLDAAQRAEDKRQLHNLLFAAFAKEQTKLALPTLNIIATIHAAVRWNRQQRFKANDFLDYQHAAAAIGYCDAFFTEKSLASRITSHHVGLDRRYGCKVAATTEDALQYLRNI